MTKLFFIFIIVFSLKSYSGIAPKVVYGDDNRLDVYQTKNEMYKALAGSTAAMIGKSNLDEVENGYFVKSSPLTGDGVCADEKFAKQPTAAVCSGFLVGDQYLVTAGHCVKDQNDCEDYKWVFTYANTSGENETFTVAKNEVYSCSKIISQALENRTLNDYSLIMLDRKVTNHRPLKFRRDGKLLNKANILVIGHPTGLPTKISDGAYVRKNTNKYYFVANLDTFGGNSGSAVFDQATGLVEGILVRGETDYVLDSKSNCYRPKKCSMTGCRGEDVTRITNIKELATIQ